MYNPTITDGNAEDIRPDSSSPMDLLVKYLELHDAEHHFGVHSRAYALSLLDISNTGNLSAFTDWQRLCKPVLSSLTLREDDFIPENSLFGKWIPRQTDAYLTISAGVQTDDFSSNKTKAAFFVTSILNDSTQERTEKYEAEWNGFWHFFNIMQFLPGFYAVSVKGLEGGVYHAIPLVEAGGDYISGVSSDDVVDAAWVDVKSQLFDEDAKSVAERLISINVPAPSVVGFELTDSIGAVVGEAEMVWEDKKIAFLLPEQTESEAFVSNGWKVIWVDSEILNDLWDCGSNPCDGESPQ